MSKRRKTVKLLGLILAFIGVLYLVHLFSYRAGYNKAKSGQNQNYSVDKLLDFEDYFDDEGDPFNDNDPLKNTPF